MIPGERINLWALERGDLLQNYLWGNDPEIVKLTGMTPLPRTAWDIDRWYDSILGNPNICVFAIKLNDGTYIGNVEITNIDWRSRRAELGIMIADRKHREKGFGKEAALLTLRFAFEEMGLHRVSVNVLPYNEAAHQLFLSCNFKREGVQRESFYTWGRYWDVVTYSILKSEFFEKFPYQSAREDEKGEQKQGEKT